MKHCKYLLFSLSVALFFFPLVTCSVRAQTSNDPAIISDLNSAIHSSVDSILYTTNTASVDSILYTTTTTSVDSGLDTTTPASVDSALYTTSAGKTETTTDKRFDETTLIPGIMYSPILKTGLLGVHLRMFQKDEGTDKRLLSYKAAALGGFTSKSYAAGYTEKLYLKKGKYRLDWGIGAAKAITDFYGIAFDSGNNKLGWAETPVSMETKLVGAAAHLGISVSKFAYAGLGFKGTRQSNIGVDDQAKMRLKLNGFTDEVYERRSMDLFYSSDSRTNPLNPTDGHTTEFKVNLFREALGEDQDFETYELRLGRYISVCPDKTRVLALRTIGMFGSDDTPKEMYNFYGLMGEQRGYIGKFYGKDLIFFEGELRQKLKDKLGAVAFVGVGKVFNGGILFDSFSDAEWLPNYGFGFRYNVVPEKDLNVRLDFGFGKDDEFTMYFGIGESF